MSSSVTEATTITPPSAVAGVSRSLRISVPSATATTGLTAYQ
jgi:hypothetical protein